MMDAGIAAAVNDGAGSVEGSGITVALLGEVTLRWALYHKLSQLYMYAEPNESQQYRCMHEDVISYLHQDSAQRRLSARIGLLA